MPTRPNQSARVIQAEPVAAPRWQIPYTRSLDGLRAVAALAVLGFHGAPGLFPMGYLGVDVFFGLSGFLITSVLLEDWVRVGRVRLGNFYARRFLRLFPPFFVMVLCFLIVEAFAGEAFAPKVKAAGISLLYVANWARAFDWIDLGILSHTWSLGVEEQFYFLWPLLLMAIVRRMGVTAGTARFVAFLAAGVWAFRAWLCVHGSSMMRMGNGIDTRADALLIGCAAAIWLCAKRGEPKSPRPALEVLGACSFAVIVTFITRGNLGDDNLTMFGWTLFPLLSVAVVVSMLSPARRPGLRNFLELRPMAYAGRLSYGIYLWHLPMEHWVTKALPGARGYVWFPVLVGATLGAAAISYEIVEKPFLRLKDRLKARDRAS